MVRFCRYLWGGTRGDELGLFFWDRLIGEVERLVVRVGGFLGLGLWYWVI